MSDDPNRSPEHVTQPRGDYVAGDQVVGDKIAGDKYEFRAGAVSITYQQMQEREQRTTRRHRVRRALLLTPLTLLLVMAAVYAASVQARDNPVLFLATVALTVAALVEPIAVLWDRFGPAERPARPRFPATEQTYLQGRLEAFAQEEALFVELAGDAVIETRFDAYAGAFTPDRPGARLREYTDIRQAVHDYRQFVIVGDPGAGKTTTLRRLATEAIRARLNPGVGHTPLPLWIDLGVSANPCDAGDLLRYWWHEVYNLPGDPDTALANLDVWLSSTD